MSFSPTDLVGAALAISLVLDAIADPLIGSWSDSVRSKFGLSGRDLLQAMAENRADWTLTSKLSFQLYVQPFIASGEYHDVTSLAAARSACAARRARCS